MTHTPIFQGQNGRKKTARRYRTEEQRQQGKGINQKWWV
jgi:hypothetical protein